PLAASGDFRAPPGSAPEGLRGRGGLRLGGGEGGIPSRRRSPHAEGPTPRLGGRRPVGARPDGRRGEPRGEGATRRRGTLDPGEAREGLAEEERYLLARLELGPSPHGHGRA